MGDLSGMFDSTTGFATGIQQSYNGFLCPQIHTDGNTGTWGEHDQYYVYKLLAENGHVGALQDIAEIHSHKVRTIKYVNEAGDIISTTAPARKNPYEQNAGLFDDLVGTGASTLTTLITEITSMGDPHASVGNLTSVDNAMTTGMAHAPSLPVATVVGGAFTAAMAALGNATYSALFSMSSTHGIVADVNTAVAAEEAREQALVDRKKAAMADSFQSIRGVMATGFYTAQNDLDNEQANRLSAMAEKMDVDLIQTKAQIAFQRENAIMTTKVEAMLKMSGEYFDRYSALAMAEKDYAVKLGIALADAYTACFQHGFLFMGQKADALAKLVQLRSLKVELEVSAKLFPESDQAS